MSAIPSISSLKDYELVATVLREDRAALHRLANDAYNMRTGQLQLLHKALYDYGPAGSSDTAKNLGLSGSSNCVLNGDQLELLAQRYTDLLLDFCTLTPKPLSADA